MKLSNSLAISLLSLAALTYLGHRGMDVVTGIVGVSSAYVIGRAGQKSAAIYSASRDPNADTVQVIKDIENK